jgi:dTDP-glucose 4,6-dehydratase
MKKIIITGGLGFIGSNLIELLIKKKFSVINIDKVTYSSNFYNTKDFSQNAHYKFIKCDLNNKSKLSKIIFLHKPLCIFNLAAETHVDRSIDGPESFIKSNILGVFNLLEIFKKYSAKNKKTRLVHISTDEVYGDILKGRSHEEFPYKPSSPYAASKAASDHLVSSYVRTYKIPAIVTNCSNNYGPKQHPEKLIPKLIYNILNNKSLPIYGNGKNSREWIYVEDHCEALLKVFQKGKIGEFYNIGSNKNLNNLEICKYLIRVAKEKIKIGKNVKIEFVKDRPGHDVRYALDSKKILNRLGWKTKMNFKKGLEKTFLWYLKNEKYYKSISKTDIVKRVGKI